jgi:hypothetical protein
VPRGSLPDNDGVDESRLARSVTANRFGISAVALAMVSIIAFSAATGRGKGEELLPLGLSLLTGGAAALLAVTGWVRGAGAAPSASPSSAGLHWGASASGWLSSAGQA